MHWLGRDMRHRQQQVDHAGPILRTHIAAQQQLDIIVFQLVDPLDGLADKGFHIRRVLANRLQQRVGCQLVRAIQCRGRAELGAGIIFRGIRITRREHEAVIEVLVAFGATGRPGHLPVAFLHIHVHAVIVGDKTFIEGGIAHSQRRHEHAHLDGLVGLGRKRHLGINDPHRVLLVLAERHILYQQLVSDTAAPQQKQENGKQPRLQLHRTHYSASAASIVSSSLSTTLSSLLSSLA